MNNLRIRGQNEETQKVFQDFKIQKAFQDFFSELLSKPYDVDFAFLLFF